MTQHTHIESHILNSNGILKHLENISITDDIDTTTILSEVFLSYHKINRLQPDHMVNAKLNELIEYGRPHGLTIGPILALKRLSEYFFDDNYNCHITLPLFSEWQTLISRVSQLPLQATFSAQSESRYIGNIEYHWPIHPFHPIVEDYIDKNKLHETHQHLNGSSTAEACWLDAIKYPNATTKKFFQEYTKNLALRQLCAQISSDLTPNSLLTRLRVAALIRKILISCIIKQDPKSYELNLTPINNILRMLPTANNSPIEMLNSENQIETCLTIPIHYNLYNEDCEFTLMKELLYSLINKPNQSRIIVKLLWTYILIQNQYITLLVQRDDFYGFDQFQKYTFTELREFTEINYEHRFKQAHGYNASSNIGFLEGRLAPKKNILEFEALLTRILNGYCKYLYQWYENSNNQLSTVLDKLKNNPPNTNQIKLALVIHFIKKPDNKSDHFAFESLYGDLTNQASILIYLLKAYPSLSQWVRGIDAAANEMDTPPEIFSPIFRTLKRQGIKHITYHVGEDFPHLVSGIRAIDDALRFIPFTNGDRLGHCTAIGIPPQIWHRSLPPHTTTKRETYLLDLIFVWRTLRHMQHMLAWTDMAASEAVKLARYIFDEDEYLCIELLDEVFELRELYPLYGPLEDTARWQLRASSMWNEEYKMVDTILIDKSKSLALELYRKWLFNRDIRTKRNEAVSLPIQWLPDKVVISLQQEVMKNIVKKNLAIECPPTSNTRISQYSSVEEHHIFRWLGLANYKYEGDTEMSICLASDDPGIFVTDLKSEFYHLFSVLTQRLDIPSHDAVALLSKLNENGRIFRFHTR